MSRSHVRMIAIACGLLALPIRLYYDFELAARSTWWAWFLGMAAAAVLIPFGLFFLITYRALARRSPLRLNSERGEFVADASLRLAPLGIVWIVLGAGVAIPVERIPNTDRMRLSTVPGFVGAVAAVVCVFLIIGIAVIIGNRPRVVLDRTGLTLVGHTRTRRLAWSDLVAGSAYMGPRAGYLYVQTTRPDPKHGALAALPVGWLDVDPLVFQAAVRTYTDQPQRRDEIGTAAELARLNPDSGSAAALDRNRR